MSAPTVEATSDARVRHAVVNAGFVAVLSLLALFTFDRSFSDRGYLVVGAVAVMVPLVMAVLLHLAGIQVGRFAIFAYLLFLPLAAITTFHSTSPAAIGDVMRATVDAPRILLTTIPPADADGAVLVLPFTLAYVCGAAGTWLALKSTKPIVPLLPIVAVLALCVVFGTEETRSVVLKSAAFVAVALWWVALRAGRDPDVVHSERGGAARALGSAAVIVLIVLVVTSLVGDAANRLVLRGILGTGYDVSRADNPLAGLREYTRDNGDGSIYRKRLLTVRGLPRATPMRFVVLDTYDGFEWSAGNDTVDGTREDRFQQLGSKVGSPVGGTEVSVKVNVSPVWNSDWLPLAGYLTDLAFEGSEARSPMGEVRYNPATGSAMVIGGLTQDDNYSFSAVIPDTDLPDGARPYANDGDLQPEGDFLDDYLQPWRDVGMTPIDRVLLLAEYLKNNGIYSDGAAIGGSKVPRGHSKERLAQFAYEPVGDGEQYASFVALAANRLGVPARVVVGAHANRRGLIRGRDVEAWIELRIADGSWRVLPTESFQGSEALKPKPPQTPDEFIEEEKKQQEAERRQQEDAARAAEDADGGGLPWTRILLVLLSAVLVGVVPGLKQWRRRKRSARSGADAVVGAWRELLDQSRDLGVPIEAGATRPRQAEQLGGGAVLELAERADVLVFSPEEPDPADTRAFWERTEAARSVLRERAGGKRRLWARWNPASLRASRLR